ncbi:hypothetical protein AB4Z48_00870 [Cupriavidus sp. 2TAF22]|uniref:hypothetical protein n=1 Tax=unclassified Cupriavidus TaxID=2640874 RepID=UPI003F8DA557
MKTPRPDRRALEQGAFTAVACWTLQAMETQAQASPATPARHAAEATTVGSRLLSRVGRLLRGAGK